MNRQKRCVKFRHFCGVQCYSRLVTGKSGLLELDCEEHAAVQMIHVPLQKQERRRSGQYVSMLKH